MGSRKKHSEEVRGSPNHEAVQSGLVQSVVSCQKFACKVQNKPLRKASWVDAGSAGKERMQATKGA